PHRRHPSRIDGRGRIGLRHRLRPGRRRHVAGPSRHPHHEQRSPGMTRTDRPTGTRPAPRGTALISGAGIAGCALAHWLDRAACERRGLRPRRRDAHVGLRRPPFLSGDGSELTSLPPHAVTGGDAGRDLEIPRGELTEALYATVRDRVEFVFDDRVDTLVET